MADSDTTIELLKDIRDEIRGVRGEVRGLRADTKQRLDLVATTLLDLGGQSRLIVRYTKEASDRPDDLLARLSAIESRVDKLESR